MALARQDRLPKKPGLGECLAGLRQRAFPALARTNRQAVEVYPGAYPRDAGAFDAVVCGTDVTRASRPGDFFEGGGGNRGPGALPGVEDSRNGSWA